MVHAFPEIVDQHVEEAAFLWLLRDTATCAPNYNLGHLGDLDERIDAHLDGLRVAGAVGWEACKEQLEWREAGEVFVAACIALQTRIGRRVAHVLEIAAESSELARGFVAALAWLPIDDVQPTIYSLLKSRDAVTRRIGIAALAVHRRDPGTHLVDALADPHPTVRSRAVKAAGELGRRDLRPVSDGNADCADPGVRFWTAWTNALLGDVRATSALCETAIQGGADALKACDLATRTMTPGAATKWRRYLADVDAGSRLAIVAADAHGDPAAVPWLIGLMADNASARFAGEAFSSITGVNLTACGLSAQRPDGFESGPTDDPSDDNVAIDPDENLPWPRQAAIRAWWSQHGHRFTTGTRYLMGWPIGPDTIYHVLASGTQRQRGAAALELALRSPRQPLFEVRARADHQRHALVTLALR
jgi:uncharacterized protein (TIGR02270 family)